MYSQKTPHTSPLQESYEVSFARFWEKMYHEILRLHCICLITSAAVNTLRRRQNGCHFADDIFNCIFSNENVWISINISVKFVPRGQINNIPSLVQIMAWRRPGDKPLSEPMMVSLLTHICVTRPQWVKRYQITESRMSQDMPTKSRKSRMSQDIPTKFNLSSITMGSNYLPYLSLENYKTKETYFHSPLEHTRFSSQVIFAGQFAMKLLPKFRHKTLYQKKRKITRK